MPVICGLHAAGPQGVKHIRPPAFCRAFSPFPFLERPGRPAPPKKFARSGGFSLSRGFLPVVCGMPV